ncbi:MAG: DUF2339 domain-containing protein, partial [Acidobacteriota bacterium]
MIWVWALIAGLIGAVLESEWSLGFVGGAALAALVVKLRETSRRLEAAEKSLAELWRVADRDARKPAGAAEGARTPAPAADLESGPPQQAPAPDLPSLGGPPPAVPQAPPTPPVPASRAAVATAPVASSTTPPPSKADGPAEQAQAGPTFVDRAAAAVVRWFTEGNLPVKVGVLVLFIGVAAALRFAAAEGYFRMPIGWRLSLIAVSALAGLAFGWRERVRRPAFALSLQGGAVGVLLLTIFASFRLYQLIPAEAAFALVTVLVAGTAMLAVLQRTMALAVLGFLGGYLAPVLLSTGSGSHVALFSFYAVLNAAVLAISWRHHWRVLNLIGFVFTFGVGARWFAGAYRPEMFWSVEPFLILFFLFYVFIGLLYFIRPNRDADAGRRGPWLDGSLIFGTPLVAFPMQAVLLRDQRMALAFSALAVAGVYLGLMLWLRRRREGRLLIEAYSALALGFATLAV